jgi:ABC-type lipoprotein export system ATPase subunit
VLRGQLDVLGAGRGSVVLVTGPAGAGKTTLLAEAARLAADRASSVSLLTSGSGCCASCRKPSTKPHTAPRC